VQEKLLHQFHRVVIEDVDQSAQDADAAGQDEMKRLLAEPDFFADAQQPPPMAVEEVMQLDDVFVVRRNRHTANLQTAAALTSPSFCLPTIGVANQACVRQTAPR